MKYTMFTSPNCHRIAYAASEVTPPPAAQGPWNSYPIPELPLACDQQMMLMVMQRQGYAYHTDKLPS